VRPPAAYMHLTLESCPYSCAWSRCRRTTMYRPRTHCWRPRLARPAGLPTMDQHARPRRCCAPASPTCVSMEEKRPVCMGPRLPIRGPQEARTRGGSVLPEVSPSAAVRPCLSDVVPRPTRRQQRGLRPFQSTFSRLCSRMRPLGSPQNSTSLRDDFRQHSVRHQVSSQVTG
jgi:hypothetical protein